jgi:serine/threonine protein kinase
VTAEELLELFEHGRELRGGDREAWLVGVRERRPEVAERLARLLAADDRAGSVFDRLPPDFAEDLADEAPPETIGPYRIVREIGRGGMGHVFLAEQHGDDFIRRVALKRLDRRSASAASERRLRDEVRILAALEHSGIARFLDGGRDAEGASYLVLEYVEGLDLIAHTRARGLDLEAKLRLFLEVLAAVEYAHGKRVVHRDLKPGNVLVGADGRPKLLDFGIAKLLEREADPSSETRTDRRVFTPAYASPEQILGKELTVASDIYSLGVMLYELVAGIRPFETSSSGARELERAVVEDEPKPPSTAARRRATGVEVDAASQSGRRARALPERDLDAICLKTLRKEPASRYASARELAADLERLLDGRPVAARRGGVAYRLGKRVRRLRAPLTGAAVATLVGTMVLLIATRRAPLPAPPASGRPALSRIAELSARFAEQPNDPATAGVGLELIDTLLAAGRGPEAIGAVGRLRQLPGAAGLGPRVDLAEARAALAVSELQRAAAMASTAAEGAARSGDAALDRRARLVHARALVVLAPPAEVDRRLGELYDEAERADDEPVAVEALVVRAEAARKGSRGKDAKRLLDEALPRIRALGDRRLECAALVLRSRFEGESGELDAALGTIEEALALARASEDLAGEATAWMNKMVLENWRGDAEKSLAAALEAIPRLRLSGNREQLLSVLSNLAIQRVERGEFLEAEAVIAEAEPLVRELGSPRHRGAVMRARGYLEEQRGETPAARASYRSAIEAAREAAMPGALAFYLSDLAWLELNQDDAEAAEAPASEASELFERGGDERSAVEVGAVLAWVEAKRGDAAAARRHLARLAKSAASDESESAQFVVLVAEARVAEALGEMQRAIAIRRRSCELARRFGSPGVLLIHQLGLARVLDRAGERSEAVELARELLPQAERLRMVTVIRDLGKILDRRSPVDPGG